MRKVLYFLAGLLVVLIAIEVGIYQYLSKNRNPRHKKINVDPKSLLLSANEIPFRSEDNVDLVGWLIHGRSGYPALIVAHNYGSNRSETLARLERLITELNRKGYFIFLFDFRGHGESKSLSALGYEEGKDLQGALKTVLKFNKIQPRIGVLGIGMGAIAASVACNSADEVKLVVLDSIYDDIPGKNADTLIVEWPFLSLARPALARTIGWNYQHILKIPSTQLELEKRLPQLYPKGIVFVEKEPLKPRVRKLYEAAREPKELLQLRQTAAEDLIGEDREEYARQLDLKIQKYLPPVAPVNKVEIVR